MRLKLLLFALLLSGSIVAQEAYRGLVITEARQTNQDDNYIEITNVGNQAINLKDFKLGTIRPWAQAINDVFLDPWVPEGTNRYMFLPDFLLEPGKSFVVACLDDFHPEQYALKTPGFEGGQLGTKRAQMFDLADLVLHRPEPKGDGTDSITRNANGVDISWMFESWGGRECMYLEHHLSDVDSVVIDQVGGVFDNAGQNFAQAYDVAGVIGATGNSILVRKASIKQGNVDFANARGVGADDSEWIPLQMPDGWDKWRDLWWTIGNHGSYVLDENTLESDIVDVDFASKTITVPWGVRRGDGVMRAMKKKPGIAWVYALNPNFQDSLTFAARTGDSLHITVAGDKAHKATFNIVVAEPAADANIVVPVTALNYPATSEQWWRDDNQEGLLGWPRVTEHGSGPDTITGTWYGIPYATRVDSLLMHLEKASNASWEIVPVGGVPSPDLKNGDKLKVTAQNGTVKEYFIEVQPLQPNHNANLLSITWPDIPNAYRGLFGWVGDTVPGFNSTTYNYRITVPMDVDGIPALVAKTDNLNAKIQVNRATSLYGTTAQRTVSFVVTAEDDSVTNTYNVELVKEIDPSKLQPYSADPFLSEFVFWDQWSNSFAEVANPGNQPLDLSNYMFANQWNTDPSGVITSRMETDEWLDRYDKYVPGYKWVNEAQWAVTPGILEQDLNVNAIVLPGDVFAFGGIQTDGQTAPSWLPNYVWPVPAQLDIQFHMYPNNSNKRNFPNGYSNPWGEAVSGNGTPLRKWSNSSWYMYKILNDSIKQGLKPANDPNDFELIETWSMASTTDWIIGGKKANMITNWIRKPHIYKGNTGFETSGSFGSDPATSEWNYTDQPYWQARNAGWPLEILNVGNDIGQHFMFEPTQYKSTVSSIVYKVTEGYSMNEGIRGLTTGVTVADFMGGLTKAHEMQTLMVKRADVELAMGDAVELNDVLEVMSADSTNTTKYILNVSTEGLSSNAVITSTRYTVNIEQQPKSAGNENAGVGNITGIEYGTALRTVLANITIPQGATLAVVDGQGAYVPLRTLNFDTAYVNVTVNSNIYLNVVAENGITEFNFQLIPSSSENDAFLLSDVYSVVQKDFLVQYVPRGTNVSTLMSNIVPSGSATVKLVNKMGQERLDGGVADDDKLVVTSANGAVTKTYYIAKLASEATPEAWLAYILSPVYAVDQVTYKVAGVSGNETVPAFLAKITSAPGATALVVDKDGMPKTSGDLVGSDKVKVTSADGKLNVFYTFGPLTSANVLEANDIRLYPNPTNGEINVSGLKAGQRIQVYNSVGAVIRDINVQSSIERVSLRNQSAGMYMIVVSDNSKLLGRYKAMKQ